MKMFNLKKLERLMSTLSLPAPVKSPNVECTGVSILMQQLYSENSVFPVLFLTKNSQSL